MSEPSTPTRPMVTITRHGPVATSPSWRWTGPRR